MKNFILSIWKKVKRTKKTTKNLLCFAILERELRQRRITERWSINMLSDYYSCSENEMREILDNFKIQ